MYIFVIVLTSVWRNAYSVPWIHTYAEMLVFDPSYQHGG